MPPYYPEVWVVGGGPSSKLFDPARLTGKVVLLVNDALSLFSSAQMRLFRAAVAVSVDNDWIRRRRPLLKSFDGEKYFALPLETWPDCGGITGAVYLQRGPARELSDDPAFLNTGGNSGYSAINLAYLKGAREIHLIGFDMNLDTRGKTDLYEQWIPGGPRLEP